MRTLLTPLLLLATAGVAHADRVHLFGPPGDGSERSVLVSLEREDGRCLESGAEVEWSSSDPDVRIRAGSRVSQCVRWLHVSGRHPRSTVSVRAHYPDFDASARLPMHDVGPLALRLRRRGPRVFVSAPSAQGPLHGTAYFGEEQSPIECDARGCSARAPSSNLVMVVARDGLFVGVGALEPAAPGGLPQYMVVPTQVGLMPGGPASEVAYTASSDSAGRLTSRIPLRFGSETGIVRGIRWASAGVAALSLSVGDGVSAMGVRVRFRNQLRTVEVPLGRTWSVSGNLVIPSQLRAGQPFTVDARASTTEGEHTPSESLRVRCGAGAWAPVPTLCTPTEGGDTVVTLAAMNDGRPVPIGFRIARVTPVVVARR